jgi:hypothetical protein
VHASLKKLDQKFYKNFLHQEGDAEEYTQQGGNFLNSMLSAGQK